MSENRQSYDDECINGKENNHEHGCVLRPDVNDESSIANQDQSQNYGHNAAADDKSTEAFFPSVGVLKFL